MPDYVLIVDDEPDLCELLALNLGRAGYRTSVASDGREALASIDREPPDLIILDVMLPGLSGIEVAGRIRSNPASAGIPILMLTAKGEEVDEVVGLTVGADDYVTKPFSMKVLLARVEALRRRTATPGSGGGAGVLRLGPIELNTETHDVALDREPLKLTLTEFRLLRALLEAEGKVLSRTRLMSDAMGPGVTVTERTIDVHVTAIRKKLGGSADMVKTVRGVGYRLVTLGDNP